MLLHKELDGEPDDEEDHDRGVDADGEIADVPADYGRDGVGETGFGELVV